MRVCILCFNVFRYSYVACISVSLYMYMYICTYVLVLIGTSCSSGTVEDGEELY